MEYSKAVLACIPSGVKASTVYNIIGGDFTFSRSGGKATRRNKDGLIESVDSNVPRLDYEGAYPHLLLEPTRTNLIGYSEDFDNWTQNAAFTEYFNYDISPDGNKFADRIFNTSGANRGYYRTATGTTVASTDYTFSVFAKGLALNKTIRLELNSATFGSTFALFDLNDGSVTSSGGCTAKIEAYKDGWYRVSIVANSDNTSAIVPAVYAPDDNDVLIWGAQLELGSYATSYIPNLSTGSTTRTAEAISALTANFNPSEGALFFDLSGLNDGVSTGNKVISLTDGTVANSIMLYLYSDVSKEDLRIYNAGTSVSNIVYVNDIDVSERFKIAFNYGATNADYKVYLNGTEVSLYGSFSATALTSLTTLKFTYATSGANFYGKVRQAIAFKEALTDSQLAELTK